MLEIYKSDILSKCSTIQEKKIQVDIIHEYFRKYFIDEHICSTIYIIVWDFYVCLDNNSVLFDFVRYLFTNKINGIVSANVMINYMINNGPLNADFIYFCNDNFSIDMCPILEFICHDTDSSYDAKYTIDMMTNIVPIKKILNCLITSQKFDIDSIELFCDNNNVKLLQNNIDIMIEMLLSDKYDICDQTNIISIMYNYKFDIIYELYAPLCKYKTYFIQLLIEENWEFYNDICDVFVINNTNDDVDILSKLIQSKYYFDNNTYKLAKANGNIKCARLIKSKL
jgi:hypothetical protein